MRELAVTLVILLLVGFAVAMKFQEGEVGEDLTITLGVIDEYGEEDTTSNCNLTFRYENGTIMFQNYQMNTTSSMLRNITILSGNFTEEGNYLATSKCGVSGLGFTGATAFIVKILDTRINRVITMSGTALNSTGEPAATGTAVSWIYHCQTSTGTCDTAPQGVEEATTITNGVYAMQFERLLVPNHVYKIVTNVTSGAESVNVTTYFNS